LVFFAIGLTIIGLGLLIAGSSQGSKLEIIGAILFILGLIFTWVSGGRWLVFHKGDDQVYVVEGYFCNAYLRKVNPGKLSQLTGIVVTIRIRRNARSNNMGYSTNGYSTNVSYNTTVTFSNSQPRLVSNNANLIQVNSILAGVKEWLDLNCPTHTVRIGDAMNPMLTTTTITTVVVNPNQQVEQELRSLIVQYEMSQDTNFQAKGQQLNLAMEYNGPALVNTYIGIKQQNPVFTFEGEQILLQTAQNIIQSKNNGGYMQQPTTNNQVYQQQVQYQQQPIQYQQQPVQYQQQQPVQYQPTSTGYQ